MSKIENPVVLIRKRDNNDSYTVAITSGSKNFHDAVLMASMEPDMVGDDVDTWSKTGYYMAQEIELWRRAGALAISRLDAADESDVWQAVGFALGALECAAAGQIAEESNNCRSSVNVQVVQDESRGSIKSAPALDSSPKIAESRCSKFPASNPIGFGYRPGCECLWCKGTARICAELGGWTPVSERLPEKSGTYQVWNGKHVSAVPFFFGSFQYLNPEQVTHWMPSANPPRETK